MSSAESSAGVTRIRALASFRLIDAFARLPTKYPSLNVVIMRPQLERRTELQIRRIPQGHVG